MNNSELVAAIRNYAKDLDIQEVAICSADPLQEEADRLDKWLSEGKHGDMAWMKTRAKERVDPKSFFPEAKSILVATFNYYREESANHEYPEANISLYARGRDYHKVIRKKLSKLLGFIQEHRPEANGRVCVDSFPIMEKPYAVRAGLGWIGKHTNLISKKYGSWFFLGEIILSIDLPWSEPFQTDHCGSCTRCVEACPTSALDTPFQIDAAECISYLTIEHSEKIDERLQKQMGNWVFGCDICQVVCPWNRFSESSPIDDFRERMAREQYRLNYLSDLSEDEFNTLFAGTPVRRAGYRQFLRNVQIAKNNLRYDSTSDKL